MLHFRLYSYYGGTHLVIAKVASDCNFAKISNAEDSSNGNVLGVTVVNNVDGTLS